MVSGSADAGRPAPSSLAGEYESALSVDGERIQLKLLPDAKARIIAEYNFQIPGDPEKRRGRSTGYAKWSQKGRQVILTYSHTKDVLRFDPATALERIGASGTAPALSPVKPIDPNSRLKGVTLWKAPHEYRVKERANDASHDPATPTPAPRQ